MRKNTLLVFLLVFSFAACANDAKETGVGDENHLAYEEEQVNEEGLEDKKPSSKELEDSDDENKSEEDLEVKSDTKEDEERFTIDGERTGFTDLIDYTEDDGLENCFDLISEFNEGHIEGWDQSNKEFWDKFAKEIEDMPDRPCYEFRNDDLIVDMGPVWIRENSEPRNDYPYALSFDLMIENISDVTFYSNPDLSQLFFNPVYKYIGILEGSEGDYSLDPGQRVTYSLIFPIDDFSRFKDAFVLRLLYNTDSELGDESARDFNMGIGFDKDKNIIIENIDDRYNLADFFGLTRYDNDDNYTKYFNTDDNLVQPSEKSVAYWNEGKDSEIIQDRISGYVEKAGVIYSFGLPMTFDNGVDQYGYLDVLYENTSDADIRIDPKGIKCFSLSDGKEYKVNPDLDYEEFILEAGGVDASGLFFDGVIPSSIDGLILTIPGFTDIDGDAITDAWYVLVERIDGIYPKFSEISEDEARKIMDKSALEE